MSNTKLEEVAKAIYDWFPATRALANGEMREWVNGSSIQPQWVARQMATAALKAMNVNQASSLPLYDPNKPRAEQGLVHKFNVTRTDGSSEPGQKHDGCEYFVLDMTHDKHAAATLLTYALLCEEEYPMLARDIRNRIRNTQVANTGEDVAVGIYHELNTARVEFSALEIREFVGNPDLPFSDVQDIADVLAANLEYGLVDLTRNIPITHHNFNDSFRDMQYDLISDYSKKGSKV